MFVRDRVAGVTRRVSIGVQGQGNGASGAPALTASGRSAAFASLANNLVPGDTNSAADVFVRDPLLGAARAGAAAPGGGFR